MQPRSSSSSKHSPTTTSHPQTVLTKRSQEARSLSPMTSNASKQQKRQLTKWSGLVVNTHGWIFDYGYQSTMESIRKLTVSTVLVLGDYRLYERLHNDLVGCYPPRGGGHSGHGNRSNSQASSTSIWSVTPVSGMKVLFFQRNFSAIKRHSKLRCVFSYFLSFI